ncbi:MAG: glycosyltransferase family 4 protein [Thermodesulfobacteriota bacterium]
MMEYLDRPLRICLLSYRSNPHCGGQGVYLKRLSRALRDLGHRVEVVTGPPDPGLDEDIVVHRLPCLDLYDPEDLFRLPTMKEFMDPVNVLEWLGVITAGFPEPYTFGLRARRYLRDKYRRFDVVHDNQSLSYGILAIQRFLPTTVTIHHPITRDRAIDLASVRWPWSKMKWHRWYSFLRMQKKVSRRFRQIITVSRSAARDIARDFGVPPERFRVVPLGVNTELFRPRPGIIRQPGRLIVTNSADTPLKGLAYLLLAVHRLARTREVRLTVIGQPRKDGAIRKLLGELDLGRRVTFTGRVSDEELVRHYARASIAVVPSVYEGFGLPAGEAMACGVPLVSTTGGALPEVVGEAGVLVPPRDPDALVRALADLMDHPERAEALGQAGYQRVHRHFTWARAAEKTVKTYWETIRDHRGLRAPGP